MPTPVDTDPFGQSGFPAALDMSAKATPVDHDPFADAPQTAPQTALGRMTQPIVEIPKDIGEEFRAGTEEVRKGESALFGKDSSLFQRAKGAGQTALGAMQQAGAPISGAVRALASDPIRRTQLPGSQTVASTVDLAAGLIGPPSVLKGGKLAAEGIAAGAADVANWTRGLTAAGKTPATSAEMRNVSQFFYKQATDKGGILLPKFTDDFVDKAGEVLPQTEAGKIVAGEDAVTDLVGRLNKLKGRPLSLDEAQEIDEHLGGMIDQEYGIKGLSKQGKKIADIQSQFRNMIADAGPDDIVGGPEHNGFEALKQGRAAWAQAAKMRDIEKIRTRAELSEQPVTAIRSGIRTILSNPQKLRGYSKQEIAALKEAAKTGVLTEVLRVTGSRLTAIAGTAGGFLGHGIPGAMVGAGAAHAVSGAARKAGAALQMKKVNKLMETLAKGAPQRSLSEMTAPPSLAEQVP